MIAVDTNVLIHAHRAEMPKHKSAVKQLKALAEGPEPWGIPVFCLAEFVRVITHPRVFDPPFSPEEAAEALSRLLDSPSVHVLQPGPKFVSLFIQVFVDGQAAGNLVFDAQIAALCREHGVEILLTEDRDFHRFRRPDIRHLE